MTDLTRYRDALATILVMCDKDPQCPSCGHPNGLPAIFGVVSRALNPTTTEQGNEDERADETPDPAAGQG